MKRIGKQTENLVKKKSMDEMEHFVLITIAQNTALKKMIDRLQQLNTNPRIQKTENNKEHNK